jgi:hypothetical protein
MLHRRIATLAAIALFAGATAVPAEVAIDSFDTVPDDPLLAIGTYTHPAGGKTLTLRVGVGSTAFRSTVGDGVRGRPPLNRFGTYWTASDRGPNFQCEEALAVIGLAEAVACPDTPGAGTAGRIYPRPDIGPAIFLVQLRPDHTIRILDTRPLRGNDGEPISGLPNPHTLPTGEVPRDGAGEVISRDASGMDVEGLVRVPRFGGRFLLVEENGPSVVEVADDGTVLTRFVPAGTETDYTNPTGGLAPARYPVKGSLPAILHKRRLNRGLESIAISRDYRHIYVMMQSPLDNPTGSGANSARDSFNIRLFKLRVHWRPGGSSLEPVAEYVYRLAPAADFVALGEPTPNLRQRDLRVSEMLALGAERFLVIERTDAITLVFEIDLANATNLLGTVWDDVATSPTLERTADLSTIGIVPVSKQRRLIASSLPGASPRFPQKLEGMAFAPDGRLMIINDDDFGITDQTTQANLVDGLEP